MDDARFDAFTRWFARPRSRRTLLQAAVSGTLGGLLAVDHHPAEAATCLNPGDVCAANTQCCSGDCDATHHCACPDGEQLCADQTCAGCCDESQCRHGLTCCGGSCVSCPHGGVCTGTSCDCPTGTTLCDGSCRTSCSGHENPDAACPTGQVNCNGRCQQCCSASDCGTPPTCSTYTCPNGTCRLIAKPGCCTSDNQCDDDIPCTIDRCDSDTHTCQHSVAPPDTRCGANKTGVCCGISCCGSDQVCQNDTCISCARGFTACSGHCVDLQSDTANCGDCNHVCPNSGGDVNCEEGTCCQAALSVACSATLPCCDGRRCADGTCCGLEGLACNAAAECCSGICCNGVCCANGRGCQNNVCTRCPSGTTVCDGACVDLSSDPNNCGKCGTSCGGLSCSAGHCCKPSGSASTCDSDSECCSRNCCNGTCFPRDSETCHSDNDCCNGHCCNGTCLAQGLCCTNADCNDDNPCTVAICDSTTHICLHDRRPNGTSCQGGAGICCEGACVTGHCCANADCTDPNPCTADRCDTTTHTCVHPTLPNGTHCEGRNTCIDGACCAADNLCGRGANASCCPSSEGFVCAHVGCFRIVSNCAECKCGDCFSIPKGLGHDLVCGKAVSGANCTNNLDCPIGQSCGVKTTGGPSVCVAPC